MNHQMERSEGKKEEEGARGRGATTDRGRSGGKLGGGRGERQAAVVTKNNSQWGEEKNGGLKSKMAAPSDERCSVNGTKKPPGDPSAEPREKESRGLPRRDPAGRRRGSAAVAAAAAGCSSFSFFPAGSPLFADLPSKAGRCSSHRAPKFLLSPGDARDLLRPVRADAACPCAPGGGGTPWWEDAFLRPLSRKDTPLERKHSLATRQPAPFPVSSPHCPFTPRGTEAGR